MEGEVTTRIIHSSLKNTCITVTCDVSQRNPKFPGHSNEIEKNPVILPNYEKYLVGYRMLQKVAFSPDHPAAKLIRCNSNLGTDARLSRVLLV